MDYGNSSKFYDNCRYLHLRPYVGLVVSNFYVDRHSRWLHLVMFSCACSQPKLVKRLKVNGPDIYILPLTGKPEQHQFTNHSGVLISISSRQRGAISGPPIARRSSCRSCLLRLALIIAASRGLRVTSQLYCYLHLRIQRSLDAASVW